ncbi:hypothetical protein HYALB_00004134 [Hymenoscyphus albidus]|uniref:1-alkyl-2-acetylglycerophosphocholine esterase n=1 Tax=Hymenoscyphus albidus TaxID=595503 RepID=A0A9N9LI51_9HELO|nr:hypothetical protein HYALB_00004134 [Hymenoscyphus albidus]
MILRYLVLLFVIPILGAQPKPTPRLPPPTGPFQIGVMHLPLIDFSRKDLFDPSNFRKLMISIYYPILHSTTPSKRLPYLPPLLSSLFEAQHPFPNGTLHTIIANAKPNAAPLLLPNPRRFIYSHGGGTSRLINTALFEDLASYGYISIAIDHPYDAVVVEFPDGTVIYRDPSPFSQEVVDRWYLQRILDIEYIDNITSDLCVLFNTSKEAGIYSERKLEVDKSDSVDTGFDHIDPVTSQRRTSTPSNSCLEPKHPRKAVLGGHSFGGTSVAGAMIAQPHRYLGGWNFDGSFWNSSIAGDAKGPFFIMGGPVRIPAGDTTWDSFRAAQTGWEREVIVNGTQHWSFTDFAAAVDVLGLNKTSPEIEAFVGTISGERAIQIQREYVRDFLDWIFGAKEGGELVKGPSGRFPEVDFIPPP